MSKDVEIGGRYREKSKRIETRSGIPFKLIYRPEGTKGIALEGISPGKTLDTKRDGGGLGVSCRYHAADHC